MEIIDLNPSRLASIKAVTLSFEARRLTFAPKSSRANTVSLRPNCAAQCKAVLPSSSSRISNAAPAAASA
eukprot:scaffold2352_cov153-Ochromonas_danica.AAC.9